MLRSIKTFRNVRARIFRSADSTWHSGWVLDLTHDEARLRFQSYISFEKGEHLMGEYYGDGTLVRCSGKVLGQAGQDIALGLTGSLVFEPSPNTVRFHVEDCDGTIQWDGLTSQFFAMDVSPRSLGGLTDRSFAPGTVLQIDLRTPMGNFKGKVSVINCRAVDAQAGHFRIGLNIVEANRLDQAFWDRLVSNRASA